MEYPCPSLDNIPLPDGAQPSRPTRDSRKKRPSVCAAADTSLPLVVSSATAPSLSTDGQLTTFNMADVPLPSTKYNTENKTLLIPLPQASSNVAINAAATSIAPSSSSSSSSSKILVDRLFGNFLSQKMKQPEPLTKTQGSSSSSSSSSSSLPSSKAAFTNNSVEEMKRFLDKEIDQLSCKTSFSEVGSVKNLKTGASCSSTSSNGSPESKMEVSTEKDAIHHEEENTDNASTVANQRITSTLPLKIKISDSSVALISLGHLGPPASTNQSQPEELIVKDDVIEEQIQPKIKVECHEDALETKTEIVVGEEEVKPESNGGTGVEVKASKSSKKHKHKKKKSHKHSKNKNKSTPKLRLHSKKHKSLTKSHSKAKHKSSSNGTKSPKKISKTSSSHSKSKSSKKSKKTKSKTESKSKPLSTESSQFESKLTKKSESDSLENPSTEDLIFVKTTSISSSRIIPKENLITLPGKKEVNHSPESNTKPKSTKSIQSSSIPQMAPKCPEGDNIVLKDTIDLSSFQDDDKPEVQLPSNVSSSSSSSSTSSSSSSLPPSPLPQVNVASQSMTKPSIAVVAPLAPTVSAVSRPAPQLQTQPLGTSSAELPTKSDSVDSVTQLSASISISPVPTSTSSQPDMLICTPPIGSQGLGPLLDPKPSSPISSPSSSLNKSTVSSPVKNLPPLINPSSPCAAVSSETPPSIMLDKSGVKDVTPKGSSLQDPSSDVHVNDAKDLCVSVSSKQQLGQVSSSVKPVNKNATLGQSGLLGLAAYFKSKGCSPSSESTKPSKSSSKKTKCLSDSSDDSSPQKRSRSVSRKSSHLSASKHSSDKRKKPCPRSRRSRSWSRSRSRSRSRSKSRRKASSRSVKKQSRSRSRSRSYSNERGRQSSFRSSKRAFSRSPHSRSRNKTYGRSRSRSRSRGRNRAAGHGSSRSRSPSKRASYRHTRSRSYSRGRYRHRISSRSNKSKSRSRSRSRSNVRLRDKRSRSRSSGRHRSYRQSNNKSRRFPRRHSSPRSRSSSASSSRSRRCRSRSKSQNSLGIDKVKLHDIAVKKLLESGQAPKEEVASLRAGGKTVQGLIDYCKRISQKELESESSDSTQAVNKSDGEEEESPFIHHPFKLRRESQPNIVLNIKNSKPLPVLTPQEKLIESSTLRLQFPVSSGSQHRAKESQWVPVQKNPTSASVFTAEQGPSPSPSSALQNPNPSAACSAALLADGSLPAETPSTLKAIAAPGMTALLSTDLHSQTSQNQSNVDNVFPEISQQSVDISQVMTERMMAVQKLQENPNDVQALNVMYKAQQEVNRWAESKQLPGQFTGSTGAKVMSQEEINGPDKRFQAWAKKEQLQNAAPVRGGIGMHLLQKMGWRQGEGLGKHNEGPTEPILVNVKVDRKGLTSHGEDPKKSLAVEVAGKHPVSALVELCSKCKWGTPMFQQVEEKGPDHKKSFMFKVTVNNITYQPTMPSNSKKNGRARAAILCLQDLGLLPRNFII